MSPIEIILLSVLATGAFIVHTGIGRIISFQAKCLLQLEAQARNERLGAQRREAALQERVDKLLSERQAMLAMLDDRQRRLFGYDPAPDPVIGEESGEPPLEH